MSSENTLTGRGGKFTVDTVLVARTTQWAVNPTLATSNEWGDSDSAGDTNRSSGRKDLTFTAEGKFDATTEVWDAFQPGDIAQPTLWINTTLYWDMERALCSDFNLVTNIDTEEVIGWTSGWGTDGKYYKPGEAGAPVRSLP